MDDYDEYDEEQEMEQEAEDTIVQQFDEKLTFEIPVSYNIEPYIKKAVEASVQRAVDSKINTLVEKKLGEKFDQQLNKLIEKVAKEAFATKIKQFDYSGNVTKEESLEDVVREKLIAVAKDGLNYTLVTGNYSSDRRTISALIQEDIYKAIKENLKPQFDLMEQDFKSKSQAALRQFAIAAVDSATAKTLGSLKS